MVSTDDVPIPDAKYLKITLAYEDIVHILIMHGNRGIVVFNDVAHQVKGMSEFHLAPSSGNSVQDFI